MKSRICCTLAFVALTSVSCFANEGDPVAIIRLPSGGIAIETMWNLSVVISDSPDDLTSELPGVGILYGDTDVPQEASSNRFLVPPDRIDEIDHVLDRPANEAAAKWKRAQQAGEPTGNAIRVRTISTSILIEVDGVRILHIARPYLPQYTREQARLTQGCDALIIDGDASSNTKSKAMAQNMAAKRVIVRSNKRSADVPSVSGNTIAVSAANIPDQLQVLRLASTAIELSQESTELIGRKETACEASQKVFEELSIKQMNFRPSNGSHTPRWNAEHMMGRELLFFSQIFHAQEPTISVIDLNPKQLPPDYVARHSDWTGSEEAKQMERVSAFTRRFAYLLNDLPLDQKAPGSSWTPRKLLLQMERHYNEHTANVKKKFQLDDWSNE